MGERALGLGGAFTGLANDPSAAFYNPAGLARLEETALSASLSLATFDRLTLKDGHQTSAGNGNIDYKGRPSLPLFVAVVRQVGKKDDAGKRKHAIAFSTFTPDQRSLSLDARQYRVAEDGRSWLSTLYARHDRSLRWYGFSYAFRPRGRFTFGASWFLSHGKGAVLEERLDLSLGSPADAGGGTDPEARFESVRISQDSKGIVGRLALLYYGDKLRVGAMFQPPSLHLKGKTSVRDRVVVTSTGAAGESEGTYEERTSSKLPARDPLPWELRIGTGYQARHDLTLDCDLSVNGKGKSVRVPWADNATGQVAKNENGDVTAVRVRRVPTFNAALGAEYDLPKNITMQTGLFTDLSAAPRLPARSETQRPDHIHRFGAALSIGFGAKGFGLALGTVARFGLGSALAPSGDETGAPYQRFSAREHTLFVFLTGARRAVSKLADAAIDMLNERRDEEAVKEQPRDEPKAPTR
jgi:long-subunit fatty acid transport protein